MKLKRTTFKLEWEDKEFFIKVPTIQEEMEFQKGLEKGKGKEVELTLDFLENRGLPKETSMQMELQHLLAIRKALTGDVGK